MRLFYVQSKVIYKLEKKSTENAVKIYCTYYPNISNYVLIMSFSCVEQITYFAVHENYIYINDLMINIITKSTKLRPLTITKPLSQYVPESLEVTFRSKLAVFADYKFNGSSFDKMQLGNIPINVGHKIEEINGKNPAADKYVGTIDDFICDKFSGCIRLTAEVECYRNHVYREYDLEIAVCETCNKTFYGTQTASYGILEIAVCLIPSKLYIITAGTMEFIHILRDNKHYKSYVINTDRIVFYGGFVYEPSGICEIMEYYKNKLLEKV